MLKGVLFLLLSALSFALSTVFAKAVVTSSDILAIELTFFRFAVGFIAVSIYTIAAGKTLRPNRPKYIILRGVFNSAAVILFFLGVQYSTVTKANMMNMTYPVFVFILVPFINREKISLSHYLFLALTMAGIYLAMVPGEGAMAFQMINIGDIFALASGLLAGFAISYLRKARIHDDSYIILFYLMAIGTLVNVFIIAPLFVVPRGAMIIYVALTTITSIAGQVFITVGYRYIDAASGSLVSSTRIVFAMVLGVSIFADPLNLRIIAGGLLILLSLVGVSRKMGEGAAG